MHSKWSDGRYSIEEMAQAAKERGYEYVAMTDHSRRVTAANGLTPRRLVKQLDQFLDQIDDLNGRLRGIAILKSAEVDILEDGSLDFPDAILKELDILVCSIHYKFNLPETKQTERIIRAMDNGIGQARRGWLEAKDVINTRSLVELRKLLRRQCRIEMS